jgi:hypothetical protein
MGRVGMDWINVAQNSDQWRALVNTVMNLRLPYGYQRDGTSWYGLDSGQGPVEGSCEHSSEPSSSIGNS